MQAIVLSDSSLIPTQRPDLTPGPGEVRISVTASGINAADLLQRRGLYPAPQGWPQDVPGLECAGVISAVGPHVDERLLGQRVCAIVGGGGHASQVLVPATHVLSVPDSASDAAAGGFAEAFLTAYDALVVQAELRTGERLLISGAAGGVGTAAIQIGRLSGAHVTAVSRHPEHTSTLLALGADEVIAPEEVANLAPVHVLLELVGAANFEVAQHRLAPFARVVVIGVGGGATAALNLLSVMTSRASITGSTLRSRTHDEKAALCSLVRESLLPAWDRGELRVPIAQEFLATDVEAAFAFFAQPGKLGKVVLIHDELP